MPVLPHCNWLQLQKDFDRIRNSLRNRVFFSNKVETGNNEVNNPSKQKSNWSAPKTILPELQASITSAERDFFSNTKPNDVKDNLSEEERNALKN